MNRRFKRRKSNYVVRKYVKRCLTFPVITKRKLKPQWGLTSASSQGGGIHTRFTLPPGMIKTLDKPYDLGAFKTVNWVMAVSDHKRQEGSGVSPTTAQILCGEFPGHSEGKETQTEPDRLPELRKWSWKSRHQGNEGRERARTVTDKEPQRLAECLNPLPAAPGKSLVRTDQGRRGKYPRPRKETLLRTSGEQSPGLTQGCEQFPSREENLIHEQSGRRHLKRFALAVGAKLVPNHTLHWSCITNSQARLKELAVSKEQLCPRTPPKYLQEEKVSSIQPGKIHYIWNPTKNHQNCKGVGKQHPEGEKASS